MGRTNVIAKRGIFEEVIVSKNLEMDCAQFVKKTNMGATDYNPSVPTTDYIITVDTTIKPRKVIISEEDRESGSSSMVRVFIIHDIANKAGINNITVSLEGEGNINGLPTYVIAGNGNSITLYVDGENGYVY